MANKITVITPYGEFSRQTNRTYTHIVLVCGLRAEWLKEKAQLNKNYLITQIEYYSKILADGAVPSAYKHCCTLEDYQRWLSEYKEKLEKLPKDLAAKLAESEKAVNEKIFKCETWCGRADLAQKAAASLKRMWHCVEIFPVKEQI